MEFTSFEFLFFFLAVALLRGCLRNFVAEKWFVLVASYCLVLSWSLPCTLAIIFVSVMDYCLGRRLEQTESPTDRKRLLVVSLVGNLGILGAFKYLNFICDSACIGLRALGLSFTAPHFDIIMPPAISYFTFASLAYVMDVYYERIAPCRSGRDYALFLAFFPKVLAGPIERAASFMPQLARPVRASAVDIETGLVQFGLGAVKKLVIADQIAPHVDLIFAAPGSYDGFTLLQGAIGYGIQIYCDFSGYSDMAIGCARLLGFRLMENFQMPYSSVTITEFWRRWHISLSAWFRDYVFIPREIATRDYHNATLRTSLNLMVTMLLCGLWHGASWNFVFWGGIHGAALAAHQGWKAWAPLRSLKAIPGVQVASTIVARVLTLSVVLVGWVFFRAQTWGAACEYLNRMVTWANDGTRMLSPYILPAFLALCATHLLVNKDRNWAQSIPRESVPSRILAYTVLLLVLVSFGATDSAPFIYFQF